MQILAGCLFPKKEQHYKEMIHQIKGGQPDSHPADHFLYLHFYLAREHETEIVFGVSRAVLDQATP